MFQIPEIPKDFSLALVRLIVAVAFFHESKVKFKNIAKFARSHKISKEIAYVVATAEILISFSMITGTLTQEAAIGMIALMFGTSYFQIIKWKNTYWANKSGWEYDVIMIVFGIIILTFGTGEWIINF